MSQTMKAVAISGVKKIEIVDVPMPIVGPRDVLLKIKSAGLCTWEQRIYTGQAKSDYPLVGGHENAPFAQRRATKHPPRGRVGWIDVVVW